MHLQSKIDRICVHHIIMKDSVSLLVRLIFYSFTTTTCSLFFNNSFMFKLEF